LRRPRHLSEAWYRDPSTYFGCRQCGLHLASIDGPAASRPSEVAHDGVPDPEGTLRAFMVRDPLAPLRIGGEAGRSVSLPMRSIFGPPLAGIDLRTQVAVHRRGRPLSVVPFAFTRHGRPWVVWEAIGVDDAARSAAVEVDAGLRGLIEVDSVEAAFTVLIDPKADWQVLASGRRRP
jgi:hypothetical protein